MPAKSLALLLAILILAGLLGYLAFSRISEAVSPSYSPSDVVYGRPLHVIHQVGAEPAPTSQTSLQTTSSGTPRAEAPETYYDFGPVGATQAVTRTFRIANRGSAPLLISAAHTTCDCTTADLTSTEVPPGKIALVTLRFDAGVRDLSGQTIRRGLILETNDPQYPIIAFWVQATIK